MGKLEKLEYGAVKDIDRRKELGEGEGEVARGVVWGYQMTTRMHAKKRATGGMLIGIRKKLLEQGKGI